MQKDPETRLGQWEKETLSDFDLTWSQIKLNKHNWNQNYKPVNRLIFDKSDWVISELQFPFKKSCKSRLHGQPNVSWKVLSYSNLKTLTLRLSKIAHH